LKVWIIYALRGVDFICNEFLKDIFLKDIFLKGISKLIAMILRSQGLTRCVQISAGCQAPQ
jgi:hypothetical protein